MPSGVSELSSDKQTSRQTEITTLYIKNKDNILIKNNNILLHFIYHMQTPTVQLFSKHCKSSNQIMNVGEALGFISQPKVSIAEL